jgi:hypothetical protein
MVLPQISKEKRDKIVDMIMNLEKVKNVGDLMRAFSGQ